MVIWYYGNMVNLVETFIHLSFSLFTCNSSLSSNSSTEVDLTSSLLFRCEFDQSLYANATYVFLYNHIFFFFWDDCVDLTQVHMNWFA